MREHRRIVLCLPDGAPCVDPGPSETSKRGVELSTEWHGGPAGVAGFAEGGWKAVELASVHGELVDRLVLVSTPIPDDESGIPLATVSAKTLLLYGSKDPAGGHRQATWWKDKLGGRVEMMPGAGSDILTEVWRRALTHLAPRQAHDQGT